MVHSTIEETFSAHFQLALRERYGRLPSAAFTAAQFNRQIRDGNCVSNETVRRWMRGCAMPSYRHLQVLCAWLKIDLNQSLSVDPDSARPLHFTNQVTQSGPRSARKSVNLIGLVAQLDPKLQESLVHLLKSLESGVSFSSQLQYALSSKDIRGGENLLNQG